MPVNVQPSVAGRQQHGRKRCGVGGRLRRSRWHVQQISELATAAASETSMKMLNNVDGKRKLKNENEKSILKMGQTKCSTLYRVTCCTVYTELMAFVTQ